MSEYRSAPVWMAVILGAMAAGTGWGIRGQFGHETGAMIAGVLFGFSTVFLLAPHLTSLSAARAIALCALGVSIGGSMTYGQTVGLTHDAELIGNWDALQWGMLGLAIKGACWIGLCGAFFGIGLSTVRYRPFELLLLLIALIMIYFGGVWLFNTPFDPATQTLPRLYFSDNWFFEPDRDLEPRVETWGGMVTGLLALLIYVRAAKGDRLAFRLAVWAIVGGAIGFPAGQALQATNAWNPAFFAESPIGFITDKFNWWNVMETTYGSIWGGVLALGVGLNRHLIGPNDESDARYVALTPSAEWTLLVIHVASLVGHEFFEMRQLDFFMSLSWTMILIPVAGVMGGRLWPYFMTLPVLVVPIAGKTFRGRVVDQPDFAFTIWEYAYLGAALLWAVGMIWILERKYARRLWVYLATLVVAAIPFGVRAYQAYEASQAGIADNGEGVALEFSLLYEVGAFLVAPVLVTLMYAVAFAYPDRQSQPSRTFTRWGLILVTLVYFGLNFVVFEYPWRWYPVEKWTGRTANNIFFEISGACLILTALAYGWRRPKEAAPKAKETAPREPTSRETPPKRNKKG